MDQSFIPHTVPGVMWLAVLLSAIVIAGIGAVRRGKVTPAFFVSGVAGANWLSTRAITAWAPDAAVPSLVGAGALICAIVVLYKVKSSAFSLLVAALYLIAGVVAFIANLGLIGLASGASGLIAGLSVEAALWTVVEIPGYVLLILIIGYGGRDIGIGNTNTDHKHNHFGGGNHLRGGVDTPAPVHNSKDGARSHVHY